MAFSTVSRLNLLSMSVFLVAMLRSGKDLNEDDFERSRSRRKSPLVRDIEDDEDIEDDGDIMREKVD
jgi:hypothetical protein